MNARPASYTTVPGPVGATDGFAGWSEHPISQQTQFCSQNPESVFDEYSDLTASHHAHPNQDHPTPAILLQMSRSSHRVTLADIAKHLGVSTATVSLALNGKPGSRIPEETVRRVREAARELG
ncbi:hypothetical protein BJP06_07795 [Corynebacterium sp. NML120713]|nr:hypothetical protein BJP06_07795 [Corynebacterium sp. NML120713]